MLKEILINNLKLSDSLLIKLPLKLILNKLPPEIMEVNACSRTNPSSKLPVLQTHLSRTIWNVN